MSTPIQVTSRVGRCRITNPFPTYFPKASIIGRVFHPILRCLKNSLFAAQEYFFMLENTVVHERNLLEKWGTQRSYHFGTGCCPDSPERTLLSAAVLQSCGVAVGKAKDV